jgi:aminomethyltransferase
MQQSPLHEEHVSLDAKLVPIGGWEMPLSYPSGSIAELKTCRSSAAVFDVSHLGTLRVTGADALERLQGAFTNDLERVEPGRAQYTHLLGDDGSVEDDIIVWWRAPELFDVMPNASNTDRVSAAVGAGGGDVAAEDVTATRAVLAVQGPEARERLAVVSPEAAAVGRFRVAEVAWEDTSMTVAGTGYTGEDGVECAVPVAAAPALWSAVVGAGVAPAGLGARDTLRLEAGLPLHGQELGPGITPLQAGLGWVVRWDKGDFRGKAALEAERDRGPSRLLKGLAVTGRRPPRSGQRVLNQGVAVGEITSGNFSPMLGHGIALALLTPDLEVGQALEIDARGSMLQARVVETPFFSNR